MKTGDRLSSRVLLIGWEAAEWNIIAPLVEAGELPNLNRLIDHGVIGRLAAFDPPLPPIAWTSVITGKHPQEHGILGFEEPAENGIDVQPFSSESRRCKAVWSILSSAGLTCHVIGLPGTWPAEKLSGVMLAGTWDETGAKGQFESDRVWPPEFAETAAELRMDLTELNVNDLRQFVPAIGPEDLTDPAILTLGRAVAMAASRQAAATYLMENEPWDFLAVYFPSLDDITRAFIEFQPPRLAHLTDERFEKFRRVVAEAYRFQDQMLGRLVDLAGPETTVCVCSTRGVQTGEARSVADPGKAVSYGEHYHLKGIFFMSGPTVRSDELVYGATIYDFAPTILALLGVAIPRDIPGRVLADAFSELPGVTSVDSWESQTVRSRERPALTPLADGSPSPAMLAARRNDFNLARALQASRRHDLALPLLESTQNERPLRIGPTLHLIHCYRALGRSGHAIKALERIAAQIAADKTDQSVAYLPQFDLMRGLLAFDQGNAEMALSHLQKAETAMVQLPAMHVHLGQVYVRLRQHRKAEEAFRRAVHIDSEHAEAAAGLSRALYRQRQYAEAIEYALLASAQAPWLGHNHLQLGRCLARLDRNDDALLAVQNALKRQPALIEAHRIAVLLHRRTSSDNARIEWHKAAIARLLPLRSRAWQIAKNLASTTVI